MTGRLEGRVAIVTGGARNIGRAIGERLAAEGARVALADIEESVTQTANEVGGATVGFPTDVSSAADVDRLFDAVLDRWGAVDILVNNAAKVVGAVRHFLEADEEWWDGIIDVNLKGHFLCTHRAATIMAPLGKGVIVNFSSGGARAAVRPGCAAQNSRRGRVSSRPSPPPASAAPSSGAESGTYSRSDSARGSPGAPAPPPRTAPPARPRSRPFRARGRRPRR